MSSPPVDPPGTKQPETSPTTPATVTDQGSDRWGGWPFVGLAFTAAAVVVMFYCGSVEWPADWVKPRIVGIRAGVLVLGAAAGQSFVGTLVEWLRRCFEALDPDSKLLKNKLPQLFVGCVENVAYPWLMFAVDLRAALALIGAWLTAKSVGNWTGWRTEPSDPDKHLGRRRLYAYLIANAFQLAWGALIAGALHLVREW